jgi:hypothetical protein
MTLSIGMGLLAWGPIVPPQGAHGHADMRTIFGMAHGVTVMLSLPMMLAGAWGWHVLSRSHWPVAVRTPWRWFFGFVTLAAGLAAVYHLAPGDLGYLAAQVTAAGAFVMLLCGALAERVDARFGSTRACSVALATVGVAATASALGTPWLGQPDLRPILLLQLLPVLLIPAGALGLPGVCTRRRDWMLMLGLYATARVCDLGDAAVMRLTGALSGHALMHLCLAGVAGWLADRASAASAPTDPVENEDLAQATTSLITSG